MICIINPHFCVWQYMSAGRHDLPGDFFAKKGLWALSLIKDESGCPADMASMTWFSQLGACTLRWR